MKKALRSAVIVCVAAISAIGFGATAKAAPYTTEGAAPSFLNLEIWLGIPGDEESILLAAIGPQAINGTANASVTLDGAGDGSFEFASASLGLEDVNGLFVDLQDLGTLFVNFENVALGLVSSATPVQGNLWNLDSIGAPAALTLGLDAGLIVLYDFEGLIAGFVDDPTVLNLNDDPISVSIADLLGYNIGGTVTPGGITLEIPAIDLDILDEIVYVRLTGAINLVVVPEPSTVAMLGMGVVGLGLAVARRRRA